MLFLIKKIHFPSSLPRMSALRVFALKLSPAGIISRAFHFTPRVMAGKISGPLSEETVSAEAGVWEKRLWISYEIFKRDATNFVLNCTSHLLFSPHTQIAQYRQDGYVLCKDLLSPQERLDVVKWTNEIQQWPETKGVCQCVRLLITGTLLLPQSIHQIICRLYKLILYLARQVDGVLRAIRGQTHAVPHRELFGLSWAAEESYYREA